MKMNKKLLALILAGVMTLGLTACGGSQEETPAENSGEESSTQESSGATYTVGCSDRGLWRCGRF